MNPSMQNIQMQPSQPTVQPNMGAPSANYYNQNQHQPFQILSDPMVTNMAMQYGSSLVGSGRQIVDSQFEKYIPVSRLKYYFAVDTNYVARKLMLVLFPFLHKVRNIINTHFLISIAFLQTVSEYSDQVVVSLME